MVPAIAAVAGLQVVGGIMRARAARRAARMQAQQDENNAMLAEMAAGNAIDRGSYQEGAVRRGTSERISSDQAQLATSGVDAKSGSALDVLSSQRTRGELVARVVASNAARDAWGYRTQAVNLREHAAYQREAGDAAFATELLGGITNAAGTAAMASDKGPQAQNPILRIGEPTTFDGGVYGLGDFSALEPGTGVA